MKTNYNTNHVMLTKKMKLGESAVALQRISQLRHPGSSNISRCQITCICTIYMRYNNNNKQYIK